MSSHTEKMAPEISQPYKETFSFSRFVRSNGTQLGILGCG